MFNELCYYSINCFSSTVKFVCGSKSNLGKSCETQSLESAAIQLFLNCM